MPAPAKITTRLPRELLEVVQQGADKYKTSINKYILRAVRNQIVSDGLFDPKTDHPSSGWVGVGADAVYPRKDWIIEQIRKHNPEDKQLPENK